LHSPIGMHPLQVIHGTAFGEPGNLERLFVEERRRLKIIPNAFGERAVLKLMFGALIRAAERWRSIKATEFEHRQIAAGLQIQLRRITVQVRRTPRNFRPSLS
jgi:hypothetical protein